MWPKNKAVKSFYDDVRLNEFSTFGAFGGKFFLTLNENDLSEAAAHPCVLCVMRCLP